MKIEHKHVIEIIDQLNFLADGIVDAIRLGGDILGNIEQQALQMKLILLNFRAEHLTIKEDKLPPDSKFDYLKRIEQLMQSPSFDQNNLSPSDLTAWVQTLAYKYTKNILRNMPLPTPSASEIDIRHHVDNALCDWPKFKHYEAGFFYSLMKVIDDITSEIILYRERNPQQSLFE